VPRWPDLERLIETAKRGIVDDTTATKALLDLVAAELKGGAAAASPRGRAARRSALKRLL
jgi:hypothetical protein